MLQNSGGFRRTNPYARLTADSAADLYGATTAGGTSELGTLFNLDTTGQETVLDYFTGGTDGAVPAPV